VYRDLWHAVRCASSRWYQSLVSHYGERGGLLVAGGVREQAQARGRAHDIWATAKELLSELESG